MAYISINLSEIQYNAHVIKQKLEQNHIHFTPVVKGVGSDQEIIQALNQVGLSHFAESRLSNIKQQEPYQSFILLRSPNAFQYKETIEHCEMSIQTELSTIEKLNEAAKRLNKKHRILLMVDWKDGREGVHTYDVLHYIEEIKRMSHIELSGLAFNFMCFNPIQADMHDIEMMHQFIDQLEQATGLHMKVISGGNSSVLPLLEQGDLGRINELRVGETLFRGVDTNTDKPIQTLYQNTITLNAQIIEIKPRINRQRQQFLQAILDIGTIDTWMNHIHPLHHNISIIGATSDHLMVDLHHDDSYQVGDTIQFGLDYQAMAQLMNTNLIDKVYLRDRGLALLNEQLEQSPILNKNNY
ncbi:alanine racemase [Staphylococcus massiliensis]|uniref:Alanine racemase N-terminal domain-containing protein n=1 Tax=Staphylococcus massiliensis S46 TaxID=1229783 RepID=K9ATB9_9STAP|nr:alanine racemase [Staphylococcus massiliensis]EKU45842.1 hypothetical protein C273_10642 [Staphylococcus massiliensis S46]MCG3399327.1 alanine racemase [Staphylococcus massiliensis]MCG3402571.1 alanine racemase [Staphylococcus massiliensis]POA00667.1 alanine racemase [Staphylococcus massiliensis CCUG 55927]